MPSLALFLIICAGCTHNLYRALAVLLQRQGERCFQSRVDFPENHKGLVGPLSLAIVLGGQADLDRVRNTQGDWSSQWCLGVDPTQEKKFNCKLNGGQHSTKAES